MPGRTGLTAEGVGDAEGQRTGRRDFRWYWAGQSVSVVGDQVAAFVLPTIAITAFGASSLEVGVLNMLNTGAYSLLGLFVGVLMDRRRRRPVLVASDVVRGLAFGAVPLLTLSGDSHLGMLYAVAVVAGVCAVFFNVASQSHLPTLVGPGFLGTANARMEISNTLALVLGPALGGWLVQWWGGPTALAVNALSFCFSVAGILLIRTPEPPPDAKSRNSLWQDLREGVRVLWHHEVLRRTTLASAARNFGNTAVNTVLLLFAYRALGLSAGVAGILFASGTVAAVLGAWLTVPMRRRAGTGWALLGANAAAAVWVFAPLALVLPPLPTLLVMRVVSSFSLPLWNSTVVTLRQEAVPAGLLGRVSATAGTLNFSAIPFGALLGGLAAEGLSAALGTRDGLALTLTVSGLAAGSGTLALLRRTVRSLP
ncbi:MFS transporter [Streptomyces sp. ISL-12]|uniref:MFS transporter n=1 Tax=Streptomyces sp. ISL-12 TaxID=2819177 RepID=UPI001BE79B82|nr:MFS transporter [Streptomyces sp. ISL-12]MBT2414384.1 MFS transporter [Streptomyces sp. ISL-12]